EGGEGRSDGRGDWFGLPWAVRRGLVRIGHPLARSEFHSALETSYRGTKLPRVSAALGALFPAARGRSAAGGPPAAISVLHIAAAGSKPPSADPSGGATASAVPASGSHGRHH